MKSLVLVPICLSAACSADVVVRSPLLDGHHQPDILKEQRALTRPTVGSGNRFVTGWRFVREDKGRSITPIGPSGRLEVVHLQARQRILVLHANTSPERPVPSVEVRAAGRDLGSYPLSGRVRIPVPADSPLGRVPITLEFTDPRAVSLSGIRVHPVLPEGDVKLEGRDVVQSGWSAVDFVRWAEGHDARLVGSFQPPSPAREDQRFSIIMEDDAGRRITVFQWPTERQEGDSISVVVQSDLEPGLVRIRLLAEGEGLAARWSNLAIQSKRVATHDREARPPENPKLVILYVMDALRADAIEALRAQSAEQPFLSRLAAEGVVFERHFSIAPNTPTSTSTLFTGWCWIGGGALPEQGPSTLAESFARAGFRTAAVSSNPYLAESHGLIRGFEHAELIPMVEDFTTGAALTPNISAAQVHAAAMQWLEHVPDEEPVFLYLHTLHPHNPYTPPDPRSIRFHDPGQSVIDGGTKTLVEIRDSAMEVSASDRRRLRDLYLSNLAYNDAQLEKLMMQLGKRYSQGEVLMIITSDHGEELFDHDGVLHGFTLYDEMIRVPLIVWWPRHLKPAKVVRATDTLDLHVTLRAVAERETSLRVTEGESLWDVMAFPASQPDDREICFAFAAGQRRLYMARSPRWKLILAPGRGLDWGMGKGRGRTWDAEYVFDLSVDPLELENVAGADELEVGWLRSRLAAWVQQWRDRQNSVVTPQLDLKTRERLEALGYTE